MKNLVRSRNLWVVLALWGGFLIIAPFFPRMFLFDFVNALSIAACVGVTIAFLPSVIRLLPRNDLDGPHYFVMGLCTMMAATAVRHLWNWIWRWLGKPPWMQDHVFTAFLIWMVFTAAVMTLMSRDVVKGDIPPENWRTLGVVVAFGVAVTLVTFAFIDPTGPLFVNP